MSKPKRDTSSQIERERLALLGALLERIGIRKGEARRTAGLFAYLLLASAVFILGRTVRDTLFLSRYPLSALPWMFVAFGVASAITVIGYAQLADRISRGALVVVSTALGAVTYLATYVLVALDIPWIYPAFYVWSEIVANLFIVQFWTIANDLHDPRAARRLFPTIGAARVVGVIVIGVVSGSLVQLIGTTQLLFVLVGLMVAIGGLAWHLSHAPRADVAPTTSRKRTPPPAIAKDRYVQVLSVMILLTFATLTIGDYQFKAIARASFREDELARFFSLFYAGTGVVALLIQLFVTPALLRRFGVGLGMSVMPIVFGAAALVLPFVPILAVATLMKFADNGLQYTIHDTTVQALYGPFRPEVKARTRALLDAVVKPLAYGSGGLLLVLLAPRLEVAWLSIPAIVLVVGWVLVIPRVRARYIAALEQTIGATTADKSAAFLFDAGATRGLLTILERGRPAAILTALDQLEHDKSPAFASVLARLATSPVANVRAAALRRMADIPRADPAVAIAALGDDDAEVRAAAVAATSALVGDEALEQVMPLVSDAAQAVRIAAVSALLGRCGVEGSIEGGRALATLLASPEADERIEAAKILQALGSAAYRPVRVLLGDPVAEVRRSALRAAASVGDVRLLPQVVLALHRPATRGRAAAALAAMGEPAVEPLAALLGNPSVTRAIRLVLPRILRDIPSVRTYATLRLSARVPDGHIRLRVLAAMASIRGRVGGIRETRSSVLDLVRFEIIAAYRNMAAWDAIRIRYDTPLLHEEFDFRRLRAYRRVLRILQLRYDASSIKLVRNVLDRQGKRANAIEVIDSIVEPALRPLLLPFFDEVSDREKINRAKDLVPSIPSPNAILVEQCSHSNPFVVAIALDALRQAAAPEAGAAAAGAVGHVDPLVRETALRTLAGLGLPVPTLARDDPDRIVARLARMLCSESTPTRPAMYSTLEKVLMLKSTPLFARVAAEDLAALARMAEERVFLAGARIATQGESGDEMFMIMSGSVEIVRDDKHVSVLGPGEAFGETAVLDAGPRTATANAKTDTEVLAITSEEFYEILYEQAEIAEGVIRMLVRRLREAMRSP